MTIDWSKAPADATHYHPMKAGYVDHWIKPGFFCVVGFEIIGWNKSLVDAMEFAVERPALSTWTGEGLPPVGAVCEFAGFNPEETTFDDPVVGDKVTVIAHYLSGCVQVAAFTYNRATNFGSLNVAQGAHGCFRPLRTSEQIEADQKKQEIQELMIILGSVESAAYKDIAIAIQQANFRKQVTQ